MGLSHQALYIGASGAYANQRKLEVISNNLANTSTQGYKKDIPVFIAIPETKSPITPLNPKLYFDLHKEQISQRMVMFDETYMDFSQGTFIETGNVLDLAINGKGFFAVETPDGVRFTRAGNFFLSQEGYIITQDGYKVLGAKGEPMKIPFDEWAPEDIVVTPDGGVFVGVRQGDSRKSVFVDKIAVYEIPQDITLTRKIGQNLFEVSDQEYVLEAQQYEILQGYLETSNVNPITEMMALIEAQRAYEMNTRVITATDSLMATSVRELGRV
ncbi:MAG: flagellar basal-body rod protein FlgF [Candidatus Calescibacterium sp.]|nr:flagellar basal-body rod protein FlgF [Candidatus Calescibacterium sp.]MCX7733973.1 flagellar basal-body rod protein FlgF [bacterium]MDW8086428.1 flagellar basal-body rod protein FlgF [Candidatus Calescibacterium sp.]